MYMLPQEIEAFYIIPAIRREIAKCLSKDYRISYEKIGKLLGITKPAISQYLNKKRAARTKLHPRAMIKISQSCAYIVKGKNSAFDEIIKILDFISKNDLHCEICGKIIDGEYHDCKEIVYPKILNTSTK